MYAYQIVGTENQLQLYLALLLLDAFVRSGNYNDLLVLFEDVHWVPPL